MTTQILDIENNGWYDLKVKVVQIWDNDHPAIRQVGIVGDETNIVKFISWEKSNLPLMEVGASYKITNVAVSSYEDRLQISLNATTVITRMAEDPDEIPRDDPVPEIPTV